MRFLMAENIAVYSRQRIRACALDNMKFRVLRFGPLVTKSYRRTSRVEASRGGPG